MLASNFLANNTEFPLVYLSETDRVSAIFDVCPISSFKALLPPQGDCKSVRPRLKVHSMDCGSRLAVWRRHQGSASHIDTCGGSWT